MRIDTEELSEVAIHLNLQKKYNIDVDLLDHTVCILAMFCVCVCHLFVCCVRKSHL